MQETCGGRPGLAFGAGPLFLATAVRRGRPVAAGTIASRKFSESRNSNDKKPVPTVGPSHGFDLEFGNAAEGGRAGRERLIPGRSFRAG